MSKEKKENIYKVVTHIGPDAERTDYVRAKTKQGAIAVASVQFIKAELATQEDLLALAKVVTLNKVEG